MSRRRRRAKGPPRCADCHAPFLWLRAPVTGAWRPFDPTPVDRRSSTDRVAYPVEGNRAWLARDLVEDLVEREVLRLTPGEAQAYVADLPWHAPHRCPDQHEDTTV